MFNLLCYFIILTISSFEAVESSAGVFNIFQTFNSSKVRFLLWTRANNEDTDYYLLKNGDAAYLQQSPFLDSRKTFFLFHGFNDVSTEKWILISKTNILSVVDANVISVDYGDLVIGPDFNYPNAILMMHAVAAYTASFIDWLVTVTTLSTSQIHIIGHSLGAHAGGITAQNVHSGKVERVTGLDPAGPLFENEIPERRLDKSQAKFVDVIHTNACLFPIRACRGILKAIGHVDFYPNGGFLQPGCQDPLGIFVTQCSHQRVHELWNESILPSSKFTSWPCSKSINFMLGFCDSCGSGCLDMGFYLNTSFRGTYYLTTHSSSPYAVSKK